MFVAAGLAASLAFAIIMPSPPAPPVENRATEAPRAPAPAQPQAPAQEPLVSVPPAPPSTGTIEAPATGITGDGPAGQTPAGEPSPEVERVATNSVVVPEADHTKIIGPTMELEDLGYFLRGTKGGGAESIDLYVTAGFAEEPALETIRGNGWPLSFKTVKTDRFCVNETDCTYYQDLEVALPIGALQRFAPDQRLEVELEGGAATRTITVSPSYIQGFLQRFRQVEPNPALN